MPKQGNAVITLLALSLALAGADVAVAQDADTEAEELREEALRESARQQERAELERELVQAEAQRERERARAEAQRERELVQAEAQRQREVERAEVERQRELIAQERELIAQEVQRDRELQRAEREQQQAEVQRARAEMEQARRELEQAARTIATQVQLPDLESLQDSLGNYQVLLSNFGNQARIGASVVDAEQGALVTHVTPGSGAESAGLQVGDIIQSVNGTAVSTADEHPSARLRREIGSIEPGETVTLAVERAGRTLDLDVETEQEFGGFVGQVPRGEFVFAPGERGDAPRVSVFSAPGTQLLRWGFASSPWADMELATMSEALGRYFDTSEGLLVLSAPDDDAIDIQDGDVILSISGRTPNSPEHAIRILSSFESGETIEFSIMRDGRRDTVEYTVPEQSAFFQPWPGTAPAAPAAPAAPVAPVPTPD